MGNSRRRVIVPALWEFGTKKGKSDAPINTVILEPSADEYPCQPNHQISQSQERSREPRMGDFCRLLAYKTNGIEGRRDVDDRCKGCQIGTLFCRIGVKH